MQKYKEEKELEQYADMLKLPHPVSKKHPQMSIHDRAAQFSPFMALTGFEEEIEKTRKLREEAYDKTE